MTAVRVEEERRQYTPEELDLWIRLNMPQKFAVNSLNQYGYTLSFIRYPKPNESIVVMTANDKFATINSEGEIDIAPKIKNRK